MQDPPGVVGPLVGRDVELRAARALLERARTGQGQVLGLTGVAGIGKSRLAAEVVDRARRLGFAVHAGACRAHGTGIAYLVWQPVWRSLLGIDASLSVAEQQVRLAARVAGLGAGNSPRAPLLAPVVNVPMPESDLTASLDPPARADLLRSLLLDLFRACAAAAPLVLVLEDCHWIDPASQELLELLAGNLPDQPALILATSRPADPGPPAFRPLAHLMQFTEIQLSQLPRGDAEHLVSDRIHALPNRPSRVPRELVNRVVDSAGGNPLHLEELVSFLFTGPADGQAASHALADSRLPDDISRLVLARIAQLEEGDRTTIEVASVLGTRFDAGWISGSCPSAGPPERVLRQLEHLAELKLVRRQAAEEEPGYEFKHAVIRDAVYDHLPLGRREELHGRVARFLERTYPDRLQQLVDLLAYHYGRTQDAAKQQVWFRAAADAARTAFATETAIGYYRRLLDLTPHDQAGGPLIELGDMLLLASRWTEAEEAYHRALETAESTGDRNVRAEANRGIGTVFSYTQALNSAVDQLRLAVAEFDQLQDGRGLARTLERLAWTSSELGDVAGALAAAERNLHIATEADDLVARSGALAILGVVRRMTGDYEEAIALLRQAVETATTAGYQLGGTLAANDLAGVLFERGEHVQSFAYFQQALAVAREIGDRRITLAAIGNIGECYRRRGEYRRALRCFAQAFRIAVEIGDRTSMAFVTENLAATVAAQGREREAEALLLRAVRLADKLDSQYWLCESLHHYALVLASMGRLDDAERASQRAMEIAVEHHHGVALEARLLWLRLRVAQGRMDRGAAMAELRRLRDAWVDPSEQAAVLGAMWTLDPTQEQLRRDAAALYRALYEQAPTVEYRTAYERLTGAALEPPPALPRLPEGISGEPPDLSEVAAHLDAVLRQVDLDAAGAG